jgi:hypothetical protein
MSIGYPHMMLFKERVEKKIPMRLRGLRLHFIEYRKTGGVFLTFPLLDMVRSAIANDIVGVIGANRIKLKVHLSNKT